ncbi:acetylxylan esterase [Trichodelitschia bisporula]|uniref:Acetylxylan esterase n=1 Tax=Trichodelitschia bisporula TaxID=703511 RepID=A0A6G1I8E5_9PEZI|nr:acetylxylan esterase [Trichodelitschia bisporula]
MSLILACILSVLTLVSSSIIQNGQERRVVFPDTKIASASQSSNWLTFPPNSSEISYKGRWDSQYISWWSAPGIKFRFTGSKLALSFGPQTSPNVLVGFRVNGQDWTFTNISSSSTHQFYPLPSPVPALQPWHPHVLGAPINPSNTTIQTFELYVSNWAYGIQLQAIHLSPGAHLHRAPTFGRTLEVIGDSLTAGQYASYEALSSWAWQVSRGLGVESSITAYPGVCLVDAPCWGNPRGQAHQWFQTRDTSWRGNSLGEEKWDFTRHPAADVVLIHIGTNDNNTANNVTAERYVSAYKELVQGIHTVWPKAQIVLVSLWSGYWNDGYRWRQGGSWVDEIWGVYKTFEKEGYVHYFNTSGLMTHNDIGPQWHYTDVGHVKLGSALIQYLRMKFGWEVEEEVAGQEVLHDTTYWNDQANY